MTLTCLRCKRGKQIPWTKKKKNQSSLSNTSVNLTCLDWPPQEWLLVWPFLYLIFPPLLGSAAQLYRPLSLLTANWNFIHTWITLYSKKKNVDWWDDTCLFDGLHRLPIKSHNNIPWFESSSISRWSWNHLQNIYIGEYAKLDTRLGLSIQTTWIFFMNDLVYSP